MSQINVLINSLLNATSLEGLKNQLVPVLQGISSTGGEWTPSISATNDAGILVTAALYQYAGGNICHFSMLFDVQMDAGNSSTVITVSDLPVQTTFANGRQVISAISVGDNIAQFVRCQALSSGSNIILNVDSASNGDSLQGLSVVGHYLVLP